MAWDPSLYGMTILAEFVNRNNGDWIGDTTIAAPNLASATVNAELDELQLLVEYRPEVMSEALAQMNDMVGYWAGMLMFSRSSHPWTFRLARTAIVVGEFVAMYWKRQYNRARPSQLSPGLMPPIAVPAHASYPSGHATQAYLLSLLMKEAMDGMIVAAPAEVDVADQTRTRDPSSLLLTPGATMLVRLAERVARNREVLGVHYPSDSTRGMELAGKILTRLMTLPDMDRTNAKSLVGRAKKEWADFPRAKPAAGNGTLDLP
jgi:PAP2 superfamily